MSEGHEQKPAGENRKLVTDATNHIEPPAHTEVANKKQSTPKRSVVSNTTYAQNNSHNANNVLDGKPHSVVHVEDATSAFSRTESFPVAGKLNSMLAGMKYAKQYLFSSIREI